MNKSKKEFYKNQATSIINKMRARGMEGYYCEDVDAAKEKLKELLGEKSITVGYGGSMTIDDNGFKDVVYDSGHYLIVREDYKTDEEIRELNSKMINAEVFLTSTNAITLNGELVNIDGRGNRVAYLIYGPKNVIVIAGMNKVVSSVEEGMERIRNFAAPPNTVRLERDTPCAKTGQCGHCLENSICCQTVVTRKSMIPNRIKVILIGEELGY